MIALVTAGENGEAIVRMLGDCAMLPSVGFADVDPNVGAGLLLELVMSSSLAGTSTRRPTNLCATPEVDLGDGCAGVDTDRGEGGGCVGGGDG